MMLVWRPRHAIAYSPWLICIRTTLPLNITDALLRCTDLRYSGEPAIVAHAEQMTWCLDNEIKEFDVSESLHLLLTKPHRMRERIWSILAGQLSRSEMQQVLRLWIDIIHADAHTRESTRRHREDYLRGQLERHWPHDGGHP